MGARGPKIDLDFAAQVLVDAAMLGDTAAARRHSVSIQTVYRYRALCDKDENLAKLVSAKKKLAELQWADGLAGAIKGQIDFLQRAARQVNPKDPEAVEAVTGALKVLAEVAITSRMLDARLADRNTELREEAGPTVSSEEDGAPTLQ